MNKIITNKGELVVNSKVCLTPNQCYEVETLIPWYITLVLLGSVYLLSKDLLGK